MYKQLFSVRHLLDVIRSKPLFLSGPNSKLDEVTQGFIQSSSENVQIWRFPCISVQLYPVHDHGHCDRFSLYVISLLCDTDNPLLPFHIIRRRLVEHLTWAFFSSGWTDQAPICLFSHVMCSRLLTILGRSLPNFLEFINSFWYMNPISFYSSWINSVPDVGTSVTTNHSIVLYHLYFQPGHLSFIHVVAI